MAYDQLFQMGFLNELLRRMPSALAVEVEQLVNQQGFDTLLLGFLVSPAGAQVFFRAVEEAVKNVKRFPDRLEPARKLCYARFQLGMKVQKCDG